jgi:wyosine [tRNA(Phe)-imidazoG37] synthetase (radical SAM superfamily)
MGNQEKSMIDDKRMIIYGPFRSRRLGLSLGVDTLPWIKSCTFNCLYCEIGHTPLEGFKSTDKRILIPNDFLQQLEFELKTVLETEISLDSITIGYNGEPTLVKDLDKIIQKIEDVKKRLNSKVPTSLFTNSSTILEENICAKISKVDKVIAKLDCAQQELFFKLNKPHPSVPKIADIINGLASFKKKYPKNMLVLQTLLVDGVIQNYKSENLNALASAYSIIQPDIIQIYTISRPPASRYTRPLDLAKLEGVRKYINQKVDQSIKEKIEVFPFRSY